MQNKENEYLNVFIAKIPDNVIFGDVYPKERNDEIKSTNNEELKKHKYCAWRLLAYAVSRTLGKSLSDFAFHKEESGKWVCDKFYFSLSHSENAIMVAISSLAVGVDIEFINNPRSLAFAKRILSEKECEEYDCSDDKAAYLITKWTQREAVYKHSGEGVFSPRRIVTDNVPLFSKSVSIANDSYAFTVASNVIERATTEIIEIY